MNDDTLIGQILNEQSLLTMSEMCGACQVQTEWIIELVEEGILEPSGHSTEHWQFSGPNLQRAFTVRRLQRDLGINIAGAALALELIDENNSLRARLQQ